jgi:anti-sigma regulatory factor (Ser/Thr protein kinase)
MSWKNRAGMRGRGRDWTRDRVKETVHLRFAGGPDAASRARACVTGLNGTLEALREDVLLVISELVSNSVRHAGADAHTTLELEVVAMPTGVRIEVEDDGPGFAPEPSEDAGVDGGFGLLLVDRLADRWGICEGHSSRVWVEFDRN